jgi:hypothetical protein
MENINTDNLTGPIMDSEILNQSKKSCKSCGESKDSKNSTFKLITFGVVVLFTSFYGIIKIVQDVIGLFTR